MSGATSITKDSSLASFPQGSHDSWQFHFFSFELNRAFSVRFWSSESVKHAWAWTAEMGSASPNSATMISHLSKCDFSHPDGTCTVAREASSPASSFKFTELSPISHSGSLSVIVSGAEELHIDFAPGSLQFWGVPGRNEGVFHFPDLSAKISFRGVTTDAIGYCKRYFGDYTGPWGYQFIQGIASNKSASVWTADATFGDDEYNYFKIYDIENKSITAGLPAETYHNNLRGFWKEKEIELTEKAKMEFHLKSDHQYSKLVERFGTIEMKQNGKTVWRGLGFNEKCFGTVG